METETNSDHATPSTIKLSRHTNNKPEYQAPKLTDLSQIQDISGKNNSAFEEAASIGPS